MTAKLRPDEHHGIEFPFLAFHPEGYVETCVDLEEFTRSSLLRMPTQIGVELYDASGSAWRITGVDVVRKPWFGPPVVEHQLESIPPLSLRELQERVCKWFDESPDDFFQGEPGDNGDWIEVPELVEKAKVEIRATRSIAGIVQYFGPLWMY